MRAAGAAYRDLDHAAGDLGRIPDDFGKRVGVEIPDGTVIGDNVLRDSRYYEVSANRVTLVTAEGLARAAVRQAVAAEKADPARSVPRPAPAQTQQQVLHRGPATFANSAAAT